MPKKRMSSRRRAQIKAWQLAGARSRMGQAIPEMGSYSSPSLGREKLGWSPRKQRTIKYMGKNAHKHSGGVNDKKPTGSVTIAPWARQMIKGEKPTASPKMFDASAIHGDMTQERGVPYRKRRKPRPKKAK